MQDDSGKPQVDQYAQPMINIPCIRVARIGAVRYDTARTDDTVEVILQALVGNVDSVNAQQMLDVLLGRGVGSVKSAVETKDSSGYATLNGRVDQVWVVESPDGYQEYDVSGTRTLGAEWTLRVETTQ